MIYLLSAIIWYFCDGDMTLVFLHDNVVGTQLLVIQKVHEPHMYKYHFMISCEDADGMNASSLIVYYNAASCWAIVSISPQEGGCTVCTVHVCDVCLDIVACDVHGRTWDPILGSSKLQH